MSNIIGEGFDLIIINQVNKRQEIYGSINRTPEQLQYLNANAGWVRLASSVDISEKVEIRNFPSNLKGSDLAKQYVLFGGIQKARGTNFNNLNNNAFNTEAYGIGGTEFGIKPMPGIKSAQIKTLTRGSLKEATVQIVANNRTQFDIIDILYLRLGFTMLLEWGHASYFPNTGNFVENNPHDLYTEFLEGDLKYNNILNKIQDFRLKSDGNYDAIAGKVVNFNWTYNKNGSYSITLILRSLGDVIESLKTNILLGNESQAIKLYTAEEYDTPPSPPSSYKQSLATQQTWVYDSVNGVWKIPGPTPSPSPVSLSTISNDIEKFFTDLKFKLTGPANSYNIVKNNDDDDYYNQIYNDMSNSATQNIYYIRLGYFLAYLQNNIIPQVKKNSVSLTKFNLNTDKNLIYISQTQISADPRICTFNKSLTYNDNSKMEFAPGMADFISKTNINTGKILNAYFGMDWIANTIKNEIITSTGELPLLALLKALCNGWNRATGHVNKLGIQIDETTNTAYIYDETSIPGRDTILNRLNLSDKTAKFLTFRTSGSQSGFIKDINFTTQIPANFSTLITIGSTANGYVLGADATALSRMNAGLTDRVKEEITSPRSKSDKSLDEKYKGAIEAYDTFVYYLSYNSNNNKLPIWIEDQVNNFVRLQPQFVEYEQYLATQDAIKTIPNASSPNIGFLPFNMSLTMDGLSGMKIYQKFELDTDFLPSNYPESLEFIIKGITHTIQNNEWITNIESIAIPKNPFGIPSERKLKRNNVVTSQCTDYTRADSPDLNTRAKQDFNRWNGLTESNPKVYCYLNDYWSYVGISNSNWTSTTSWSAVYVAWLLQSKSKLSNKFIDNKKTFVSQNFFDLQNHNNYVQNAVANRKAINAGQIIHSIYLNNDFYIAYNPDEKKLVEEGDILIYNQPKGTATYQSLFDGKVGPIHGDVVIYTDTHKKEIVTQGGNLSDTVKRYIINVNNNMQLLQNAAPYVGGPKYIMHLKPSF
jgi:hypothetical protein